MAKTKEVDRACAEKDSQPRFAHYPANVLGPQVRDLQDIPSLSTVVVAHFANKQ
jgi:hypothetical protein